MTGFECFYAIVTDMGHGSLGHGSLSLTHRLLWGAHMDHTVLAANYTIPASTW